MSESMTYDSLVTDITTYAERSDDPFLDQVPRFIMMAENRLASEAKLLGFVRVVTGSLNTTTLAKPVRWRRTKSFSILVNNERRYLRERGYEYCRTFWSVAATTDVPRFYADYDYENFFVVPTPATAYDFELSYYERPEPLSSANQTNWTTRYAPQLLLYACLLEAMPFLKTGERLAEFQGLYDRALQAINGEDAQRVEDAANKRS